MTINEAGLKIIKEAESCRLEAYKCPAGKWTIGWGHTGTGTILDVKPGDKITQHQAESILAVDLQRFELGVGMLTRNAKPNSNQFSALVSFAFNVGLDALERSTLLKRFLEGAPNAAAAQFARWIHADGRVLPGLVKRRAAEAKLFLEVPS